MNHGSRAPASPGSGRECLRSWFAEGIRAGHTVMLVCMDTFDAMRDDDFGIYRKYLNTFDEARAYVAEHLTVDGPGCTGCQDRLMEVFDLKKDFDAQMEAGPDEGLARFRGQVN